MPLVHINLGFGARIRKAKGIIAIGNIAKGVVAIGGIAMGLLSLGGISVGLLAMGGLALAILLSIGGVALAKKYFSWRLFLRTYSYRKSCKSNY